jgi:hypothetical protein
MGAYALEVATRIDRRQRVAQIAGGCWMLNRRSVGNTVVTSMKFLLRMLSIPMVVARLTACTTIPVGVESDPSAVFAGYHTFACMPGASYGTSGASVVQDAREAIEGELARKGFNRAEDAKMADFVVDFSLGAQDRVQIHTSLPPYEGRWWSLEDWWAHPGSSYVLDVRQYREGTLVIDIFDAHSHARVWHGWAKKELSRSDVEHSRDLIQTAVHSILKRFPPH